jgi:hypothetical protein
MGKKRPLVALVIGLMCGWLAPSTVEAAAVKLVQTPAAAGEISMSSASRLWTLPQAVVAANSFVICSSRTDNSLPSNTRATCELSDTAVTITSSAAYANSRVRPYVVEFESGVSVQRGVATLPATGGTATTLNVSITEVTSSKSFVLITERMTSTSDSVDERWTVRAELQQNDAPAGQANRLQLVRGESGTAVTVAWQVVQMDGAKVQRGVKATVASQTSVTVGAADGFTGVSNLDRSFLLFTRWANTNVAGRDDKYMVRGVMNSDMTTLTFTKTAASSCTVSISWEVVEMSDGTEVRRGSVPTATHTEILLSAPVSPAVVLAQSVPLPSFQGGNARTDDLKSTMWTTFIDATSTVRFDRGSAQVAPSNLGWQVVQFFKPDAVTKWIYATSAASLAPPALDPWSNMVLLGSNDRKVHGVTEADGTAPTAFTQYTTGGPIQSRPAVLPANLRTPTTAVNIAYVTSQDGCAYAINTSTGGKVWPTTCTPLGGTLQGGAGVWIQAAQALTFTGGVTSDVVFVGTSNTAGSFLTNNKVYALRGDTGATVWTFFPGNMDIISSTPHVDYANNAVWVTSRSKSNTQPSVWKIDAATGNAATGVPIASWSLDQSGANLGDIDGTPSPNADLQYVYVGTNGGKLNAILASTTTNNANIRTHTPGSGTGAINGMPWPLSYAAVGVATPDTIIFTRRTTIHSVKFDGSEFITDGTTWTTTLTGSPTVSAPVDDGANRLYVGASDGKVHQLDVATGADQTQSIAATGVDKGFNFRNTQPYVTDGANETYVVGDGYPTTRNGVTFGWETSTAQIRDRVAGNDRRIAGVNYQTNNGSQSTFRVDLPATGFYQIHLAVGDGVAAQGDDYWQIKDGTTVLMTIDKRGQGTANAQRYRDATGTLLTNATWPTSEVATTQTFASTILRVVIGTPTAGSLATALAHLRIVQLGTVGDPTFNADLNRIHVGATDGRIYTFAPPFP